MNKKLEKIKSNIETNLHKYIVNQEKKDKEYCERHPDAGFDLSDFPKRSDYDCSIHIDEDGNRVSIIFDGGLIYEEINCHIIITGDGVEDFEERYWFDSEVASKIFGLSKYDWSGYASYQIDVHAS